MSLLTNNAGRWLSTVPFKRFAVILLALLSFAVAVPNAQAQYVDATKIKKLPHFSTLTDQQFETQSDLLNEAPSGDKFLNYTIRLPKGWRKVAKELAPDSNTISVENTSQHILGQVAKYYSPPSADIASYVDIEAMSLDFAISARNWFLNYVLTNGYTLEGLQEIDPTRVEAIYVLVQGDISYVVRTVVQINGSRIILTSYFLPEQRWKTDKALQEKVVESFHFNTPEQTKAETTHTYAFLDLLRFDYPASWRLLAPNIYSIDGMDASLINSGDKKTINGQIDLHIISTDVDTTLAQEVQTIKDSLTKTGLIVGNLIEVPENYKYHKQIYFSRVEVYDVKSKDNKFISQEFWLGIMVEDRYYYVVSMLTPSRSTNFVTWARNTEAFQEVLESLRL